jgi:hypothetical protein
LLRSSEFVFSIRSSQRNDESAFSEKEKEIVHCGFPENDTLITKKKKGFFSVKSDQPVLVYSIMNQLFSDIL